MLDEVAVGGNFRPLVLWRSRGLPDLRQHYIMPNAQDPWHLITSLRHDVQDLLC